MDAIEISDQNFEISNEFFTVGFHHRSQYSNTGAIKKLGKLVPINDFDNDSVLNLICTDAENNRQLYSLTGIDGGYYLHGFDSATKSQSVKLEGDHLFMSLGSTLVSFNCRTGEIDWKIRPDYAGIFEFYNLEDDFLVRGELSIHRISKRGDVKWSFSGRDIWVHLDGKQEVVLHDDHIHLTDFADNEYLLRFDGKLLRDAPKIPISKPRSWWEFWR